MDKITFWQFYEHIRNYGFKKNHYFDISRKDRIKIRIANISTLVSAFTIFILTPFFVQNEIHLCLILAIGFIIELLLLYLLYYLIYANADITILNRHTEKIAKNITFWQYFKYTRYLGLTENNVFDISSNDNKRIFILNLCGFIFAFTFFIVAVFILKPINNIMMYGILIAVIIIEQLITLPFHYKIYKNIEITEYNKYADDSIFN